VESVPGACALVAALTASGLPAGEFHFIGFLPHKSGQHRKRLEQAASWGGTLVIYESPYRVERLLEEISDWMPGVAVTLARELTKRFEEYLRGTAASLREQIRGRALKGEFVVLISKQENEPAA
jgi:16S rRNA (cytidine1402-2'-O)-methyltransferase